MRLRGGKRGPHLSGEDIAQTEEEAYYALLVATDEAEQNEEAYSAALEQLIEAGQNLREAILALRDTPMPSGLPDRVVGLVDAYGSARQKVTAADEKVRISAVGRDYAAERWELLHELRPLEIFRLE